MAPKPPLSTERLHKGMAKKNLKGLDRRRFLKYLGLGTVGLGAVGVAAYPARDRLLGFFKKRGEKRRVERVNRELAFLNQNSFGSPALRREWARISVEFEEHLGKSELPKKLDYLRMVERILPKTRDLTPIDVVRTIKREDMTARQAQLIRNSAESKRRSLLLDPIYTKQPGLKAEKEAEAVRLENVANICDAVANLGSDGKELKVVITRVPQDIWDDILKDRKKGKL